ncbi:hypothetical protein QPX10_10550 [Corynebacterium pseudodiphtheriticum]|uniref:hypothetical protein n=1 Tax=Corynebacterium TaxID=1716 RepID=UPI002541A2B8|nr:MULTISPECIES: hypothetical protein [Corynebacterium]MDK4244105.1 hypothetical protein [Corynebacterium pseudodiphtheriticum]MDK4258481.1 hypothetical protein [Corynebacterium propinquum]
MNELLAWLEKKYAQESDIIQQYEEHANENGLPYPTELIHAEVRRNAYFRVMQEINTMERGR